MGQILTQVCHKPYMCMVSMQGKHLHHSVSGRTFPDIFRDQKIAELIQVLVTHPACYYLVATVVKKADRMFHFAIL